MSIKNIIKKEDNGKIARMAIVGTMLSPLVVPTLKTLETQIILHSPTVYAFATGGAVAGGVSSVALPILTILTGVSAVTGVGVLAKKIVNGNVKC